MNPAITITLPVYNGGAYLIKSIESVLNQTFKNFELLIVDDCSTDDSFKYLQSLDDPRITVFKNEKNQGLFYNLNFLIKKSNTALVKLWAQDDIMYDNCLEEIFKFYSDFPQVGFMYTGGDVINEEGNLIIMETIDTTPPIISTSLHSRIAFFTGSIAGNISNVTLTKKALEKTGLFNESMKISGDFDMWVRIAQYFPVGFIKNKLIRIRNHTGQLSRQEIYYINHLKEDREVYRHLMGYISPHEQKEGKDLLRNHKLLFYYTLMAKAFLKGSLKNSYRFFKVLRTFDNMLILSFFFVKNRIFFKKKYANMHFNNSKFMQS
jgi:glycosyltransferase involved in cell wall biosynthesis